MAHPRRRHPSAGAPIDMHHDIRRVAAVLVRASVIHPGIDEWRLDLARNVVHRYPLTVTTAEDVDIRDAVASLPLDVRNSATAQQHRERCPENGGAGGGSCRCDCAECDRSVDYCTCPPSKTQPV